MLVGALISLELLSYPLVGGWNFYLLGDLNNEFVL